jgi:hypothetical protein
MGGADEQMSDTISEICAPRNVSSKGDILLLASRERDYYS